MNVSDKDSSKHIRDFEASNKFIKSMNENNRSRDIAVEEAQHLASCTYETGSKWGQKVIFFKFYTIFSCLGSI